MSDTNPSFFSRIGLTLRVLFSGEVAGQLVRALRGESPPSASEAAPAPALEAATPEAALQLLGLLQRDGRFIDFIQEDAANFSDAEIGAAARVVHEGCRKTLREHFTIEPIRAGPEGSRITLAPGFNASEVRLTGNVVGEPPFTGSLAHCGWRATEVKLPKLAAEHDASVLAPAEVEL
jgi:Domain of unknown function (DUF2760)